MRSPSGDTRLVLVVLGVGGARGAEALATVVGQAAIELRRSEPGEATAQWALKSRTREGEAPESVPASWVRASILRRKLIGVKSRPVKR
jgi:hypothetical protein